MPSKLLVCDKSLLHRLAELIWSFICEHLDMVSLSFLHLYVVCAELLVLLNKRIAQKSIFVNQTSKIANSLVHKLMYGGADSRPWCARIVS